MSRGLKGLGKVEQYTLTFGQQHCVEPNATSDLDATDNPIYRPLQLQWEETD